MLSSNLNFLNCLFQYYFKGHEYICQKETVTQKKHGFGVFAYLNSTFLQTFPHGNAPPDKTPGSSTCLRLLFMLTNHRLINRVHIQGDFHPIRSCPCLVYTNRSTCQFSTTLQNAGELERCEQQPRVLLLFIIKEQISNCSLSKTQAFGTWRMRYIKGFLSGKWTAEKVVE